MEHEGIACMVRWQQKGSDRFPLKSPSNLTPPAWSSDGDVTARWVVHLPKIRWKRKADQTLQMAQLSLKLSNTLAGLAECVCVRSVWGEEHKPLPDNSSSGKKIVHVIILSALWCSRAPSVGYQRSRVPNKGPQTCQQYLPIKPYRRHGLIGWLSVYHWQTTVLWHTKFFKTLCKQSKDCSFKSHSETKKK